MLVNTCTIDENVSMCYHSITTTLTLLKTFDPPMQNTIQQNSVIHVLLSWYAIEIFKFKMYKSK